ncbi:MAG: hypothetical protein R6U86_05150 [Bacteroidales bacterium]
MNQLFRMLRFSVAGFFVFFLALLASHMGMAQDRQSTHSVSITASATVVGNAIELLTISEMSLIQASRLQQDDEGAVYINPVFDPEAGIMKAIGQPNAQIRVSYIADREVFRREGPGSLMFHYEVSGLASDNQRESELLIDLERDLRFNAGGEFYFWIGGRIDLQDALPGSYEGEFTIEIEYI